MVLDLKPRNPKDYYKILFWMVSRRLAFLLTAAAGLGSVILLLFLNPSLKTALDGNRRVFRYDSLPLKFYHGSAEITADDGHTAYIGQVEKGGANGKGKLYSKSGILLYEGAFSKNRYNGQGVLYRQNGILEYEGEFQDGVKQGKGKLFDQNGEPLYEGRFRRDCIVYEEMAGKKTKELSEKYTGQRVIYTRGQELIVVMPGIEALYYGTDGEDTLEGEWTAEGIYVLKDSLMTETGSIKETEALKAYFGEPEYEGHTALHPGEIIAVRQFGEGEADPLFDVMPELKTEEKLNDVYEVQGFDTNYTAYIYTFEKEGFQYTFYTKKGEKGFCFYQIETGGQREEARE